MSIVGIQKELLFTIFTCDIMHLVRPPPPPPPKKKIHNNCRRSLLGRLLIPRRNWKKWLCKVFWWGRGGGVNRMHYRLCNVTEPEVNNCFSIFTRSDLNRIRKEALKKWLVWLMGEFMREHEAVNSGCAKVRSLQYLQTWQMIVLIFLYRVL